MSLGCFPILLRVFNDSPSISIMYSSSFINNKNIQSHPITRFTLPLLILLYLFALVFVGGCYGFSFRGPVLALLETGFLWSQDKVHLSGKMRRPSLWLTTKGALKFQDLFLIDYGFDPFSSIVYRCFY